VAASPRPPSWVVEDTKFNGYVLSCECGIYFMKSGIDRHEVRSESEIVVSLEFGESSG